MENTLDFFRRIPGPVKWALLLLHAAWIFFLASLYLVYLPGYSLIRYVIIGLLSCYVAVKIYPWARILVLLGNAMVILYCLFFTLIFFGKDQALFFTSLVNVVLFSAASYFLWIPESATFYKTYRASQTTPDSQP